MAHSNSSTKRLKTLGQDAVRKQCRQASMNSPWRKYTACRTRRALDIRAQWDREDNRS